MHNLLARLLHQPQIKSEVVHAGNLGAQHLLAVHQVAQVRFAVERAGIAAQFGVDRV